MTEKDAVKCTPFATDAHWCVPVRAELPSTFFDSVAAALEHGVVRPH
jgi:tetraacyldisaccharide 4'-kinase